MFAKFVLTGFIALSFSTMAAAQATVIGGGAAKTCYLQTKTGDPGRKSTIKMCEKVLDEISLSHKNRIATYVNIGILNMRAKHYAVANEWYDKALAQSDDIAETHINYAANLIYMGEYEAALNSINKGIALKTYKMPEALYNRAIAYDYLQKYELAYKDLKRALELKPDWQPALRALSNYEVKPKNTVKGS